MSEPAGRTASRLTPPPGGEEQAAWRHVLEVLLSEPTLMGGVESLPDVEQIADESDRRIARIVLELAEKAGGFQVKDVLARCREPGDAERIAELAQRGAERENYRGTLRLALERIERASRARVMEQSKRSLLELTEGPEDVERMRGDLETLQDGLKGHRHFSPRRMIR